jgi:hypothetical protein
VTTARLVAALALLAASPLAAQDLEPKAYTASPVGATFLVGSLTRSTGAVVFDATLPITDVEAAINGAVVAVGTTVGVFGKLTQLSLALPYAWGEVSGVVGEDAQRITRAGLADLRLRVSVNLLGNPAMRLREYAKTPRRTIVGTSLTVSAPAGQYDRTRLINLGNHRWAFKPEVGLAVPRGRWDFDVYAGVWLFTSNGDFYPGGRVRSQDPVVAVQGHVSYSFKPRLWVAVDSTWYSGGATQVDDAPPGGGFRNSRIGATLSVPVGRQQSLKLAYSSGVAVRTGTDFRTFALGWQWLWLRP